MRAQEAIKIMQAVIVLLRPRDEISPRELVKLVSDTVGVAPSTAAERMRRHRQSVRDGPANKSVTRREQKRNETANKSVTEPSPSDALPPPCPPLPHTPSPPKPPVFAKAEDEESKELDRSSRVQRVAPPASSAAAETEGGSKHTRAPYSLDEALRIPIDERAQLILQRPEIAHYSQPEQWPECKIIAEFYRVQHQRKDKLGPYASSKATRRLVDAFAAGHTMGDLQDGIKALQRDTWWQQTGKRHGLGGLSLEVLDRVLNRDESTERNDRSQRLAEQLEREAYG